MSNPPTKVTSNPPTILTTRSIRKEAHLLESTCPHELPNKTLYIKQTDDSSSLAKVQTESMVKPSSEFPNIRESAAHKIPFDTEHSAKAGILSSASYRKDRWKSFSDPNALITRIEVNKQDGLLNLILSDGFIQEKYSSSIKNNILYAVSKAIEQSGLPLTIHENHLLGSDEKHYEHRQIPRAYDEKDLNRYHTLGVPMDENHHMNPHIHIEHSHGVFTPEEISLFLSYLNKTLENDKLLASNPYTENNHQHLEELALPTQPHERDELEGLFRSYGSQNTELHRYLEKEPLAQALDRRPTKNMHMNNHRNASTSSKQAFIDCFTQGATAERDDLEKAENAFFKLVPQQVQEAMDLRASLKRSIKMMGDHDTQGTLVHRMKTAITSIDKFLKSSNDELGERIVKKYNRQ